MATFLLYRTRPEDRNPSGLQAVIVTAADEATARAVANAQAPNGSTEVPASWTARDLSTLPADTAVWIEGDAVSLLGMTRGGDPI